tara:strand:- start:2666 stop:2812 length:147 start_codon:yes stop_codon:yes gene_type:complete
MSEPDSSFLTPEMLIAAAQQAEQWQANNECGDYEYSCSTSWETPDGFT